jgi:hypothetical protein
MPEPENPLGFDPAELAHQIAQAVAQLREVLAPIDEAAAGYRKQLEEQGWSPTAAETMALSFHTMILAQIRPGAS